MQSDRFLALIKAVIGGLIAGFAVGQLGIVFIAPALALLWDVSCFPWATGLWGGVAVLVSHRWLLSLHPLTWIGVPSFLSFPIAFLILIFCSLMAFVLVGFWGWLGQTISKTLNFEGVIRGNISFALFMSSLWGLSEVLLARLPFFWIGLGGSLLPGDLPLAGLARLFGSGGLAVVQLLIGWWIWRIFVFWKYGFSLKRLVSLGLFCLFVSHGIGWGLLHSELEASSNSSIALWQSSIPTRVKFSYGQKLLTSKSLQKALDNAEALKADFLVAPEGTLVAGQNLLAPSPLKALVGGFRWVRGEQRSSLLFFQEGNLNPELAIDKNRLVPLGEWLPALPGGSFNGLSAVGGLQSGEASRLLKWDGPSIAVAICYEIANGTALAKAVSNGAKWILTVANLDPYPKLLQNQFLVLAQLRAIETSRDLISVANTGPSSKISANGEEYKVLEPFSSGIGLAGLNTYLSITPYVFWREFPLFILLFTSLFFLIYLD